MKLRRTGVRSNTEDGVTMAELIVAVAVLALLMTMVSSFFIAGSRITARSNAVGQSSGTLSNAMNEISRVLRSGSELAVIGQSLPSPVVIEASNETLTLHSNVDSSSSTIAPIIVQFSLDSNRNIVEKRWKPTTATGSYFTFPLLSATPTSMRVIPGPFMATPAGAAPLFTYVDADGITMTRPSTGFTQAQMSEIAGVTVTVRLNRSVGSDTGSLVVENTVRFPTLGYTEG